MKIHKTKINHLESFKVTHDFVSRHGISVLRVIMLRLLYSQSHQSVFFHDLSPVFNQTCTTDFNRGPGLPEFTTVFFGGVRVSQYIEFCALLCQPLLILSSFYFGH